METTVKSSNQYESNSDNYGDCIIIDENKIMLYDCGSEEHAKVVLKEMDKHSQKKIDAILSHYDSDHYKGLITLSEKNKLVSIFTIDPRKHVDAIVRKIGKNEYNKDKVLERINEEFNFDETLSEKFVDIYSRNKNMPQKRGLNGVYVVGPEYDVAIELLAKLVDENDSDVEDGETIKNALSLVVKVEGSKKVLLLTGDANFESIKEHLDDLDYLQMPHHGKDHQVECIFEYYEDKTKKPVYIISDNTQVSNGGSDGRKFSGKDYRTTKKGDIHLKLDGEFSNKKTLGVPYEMLLKF